MHNQSTSPRPTPVVGAINPNWQAALIILDAPGIRDRVNRFLSYQTQRIDPRVLGTSWSSDERPLIDLALSLTSPHQYPVCLRDAFLNLNESHIRRVVRGLSMAVGSEQGHVRFLDREPQPLDIA